MSRTVKFHTPLTEYALSSWELSYRRRSYSLPTVLHVWPLILSGIEGPLPALSPTRGMPFCLFLARVGGAHRSSEHAHAKTFWSHPSERRQHGCSTSPDPGIRQQNSSSSYPDSVMSHGLRELLVANPHLKAIGNSVSQNPLSWPACRSVMTCSMLNRLRCLAIRRVVFSKGFSRVPADR